LPVASAIASVLKAPDLKMPPSGVVSVTAQWVMNARMLTSNKHKDKEKHASQVSKE